ncbi:hypothetical protein PPL_05841 [Heterostelium album PN500]|uniref:Uncharacterized protein n=1 Tax=Heterostelium pallidum (strain ATCC 26659 / Pp 5 / PN500) TaxID=670386 RepID=D3BBH3_HETP5|nr:hypothetical protein PPL_05841 [Heterostelium album PN500]EFA81006.1 hypothetical protein PPL_05841 [Heterostelium album PN500]|eukprot:XP_020433124.1 hypothetical protein PPL_05841 [Heterostelium album PN500]
MSKINNTLAKFILNGNIKIRPSKKNQSSIASSSKCYYYQLNKMDEDERMKERIRLREERRAREAEEERRQEEERKKKEEERNARKEQRARERKEREDKQKKELDDYIKKAEDERRLRREERERKRQEEEQRIQEEEDKRRREREERERKRREEDEEKRRKQKEIEEAKRRIQKELEEDSSSGSDVDSHIDNVLSIKMKRINAKQNVEAILQSANAANNQVSTIVNPATNNTGDLLINLLFTDELKDDIMDLIQSGFKPLVDFLALPDTIHSMVQVVVDVQIGATVYNARPELIAGTASLEVKNYLARISASFEILKGAVSSIPRTLSDPSNYNILDTLFGVIEYQPPLPISNLHAFIELLTTLLAKKPEVLLYICEKRDTILQSFMLHICSSEIIDLLLKMVEVEMHMSVGATSSSPSFFNIFSSPGSSSSSSSSSAAAAAAATKEKPTWTNDLTPYLILKLNEILNPEQLTDNLESEIENITKLITEIIKKYSKSKVAHHFCGQSFSNALLRNSFRVVLENDMTSFVPSVSILTLVSTMIEFSNITVTPQSQELAPIVSLLFKPLVALSDGREMTPIEAINEILDMPDYQAPFGIVRLKCITLINSIVKVNVPKVDKAIWECGILKKCVDMFFEYESNNIIHCLVEAILTPLIQRSLGSEDEEFMYHLLKDCGFIYRVVSILADNNNINNNSNAKQQPATPLQPQSPLQQLLQSNMQAPKIVIQDSSEVDQATAVVQTSSRSVRFSDNDTSESSIKSNGTPAEDSSANSLSSSSSLSGSQKKPKLRRKVSFAEDPVEEEKPKATALESLFMRNPDPPAAPTETTTTTTTAVVLERQQDSHSDTNSTSSHDSLSDSTGSDIASDVSSVGSDTNGSGTTTGDKEKEKKKKKHREHKDKEREQRKKDREHKKSSKEKSSSSSSSSTSSSDSTSLTPEQEKEARALRKKEKEERRKRREDRRLRKEAKENGESNGANTTESDDKKKKKKSSSSSKREREKHSSSSSTSTNTTSATQDGSTTESKLNVDQQSVVLSVAVSGNDPTNSTSSGNSANLPQWATSLDSFITEGSGEISGLDVSQLSLNDFVNTEDGDSILNSLSSFSVPSEVDNGATTTTTTTNDVDNKICNNNNNNNNNIDSSNSNINNVDNSFVQTPAPTAQPQEAAVAAPTPSSSQPPKKYHNVGHILSLCIEITHIVNKSKNHFLRDVVDECCGDIEWDDVVVPKIRKEISYRNTKPIGTVSMRKGKETFNF